MEIPDRSVSEKIKPDILIRKRKWFKLTVGLIIHAPTTTTAIQPTIPVSTNPPSLFRDTPSPSIALCPLQPPSSTLLETLSDSSK